MNGADPVDAATHELATIDTWNNGKRSSSAQRDVGELIGVLRYYAGFAEKQYRQDINSSNDSDFRIPFGGDKQAGGQFT
ncbi:aldehyde dehydrogenase (NAD+) [Fusarium mexicanum]|uniref:Aldehyde dehydrogenase (NAD+) n=1 Tax=Fusarium mexicanum TaxID=751941 RepID=A0A8H5IGU2_9HYPO|nr:aldehyde dehydrogenase (NAD+) [Fusarium mexicanum]